MEEATGAEFSDVWEKHMRASLSVCDSEAPTPPNTDGPPVIGRPEGWAACQGSMSNTV